MVKDVLKLQNVNITSVSRKASYIEGKPGVVLVSLGDFESKQKIMKAKKLLKDKMKYRDVYIENFLTNEKRMLDANNRRLLKAVGKDMEFTSVAGQIRKRQQPRQQNENTQVNNTRETRRPQRNTTHATHTDMNNGFRKNDFNGDSFNGNYGDRYHGSRGRARGRHY
ncbi:unnamed protein product [Mytilus edulis]|uniref:Uncharacterized protein n=1 Tax=Mytilus edulis TaxID=6550 RepID=A0A8S3SVE0_MYTED|nr:unnamed protein product [Mytilus edulis]